jgi:hypothetical protein
LNPAAGFEYREANTLEKRSGAGCASDSCLTLPGKIKANRFQRRSVADFLSRQIPN